VTTIPTGFTMGGRGGSQAVKPYGRPMTCLHAGGLEDRLHGSLHSFHNSASDGRDHQKLISLSKGRPERIDQLRRNVTRKIRF